MAPLPVIYCSLGEAQRTGLTLFVRSTMASALLERAIHDAATSIDSSLPVFDARPMTDRVRGTWGSHRLLSFLFSVFAGLALTLATIVSTGFSLTRRSNASVKSVFVSLSAPASSDSGAHSFARNEITVGRLGDWFGCGRLLSRALQSVLFEVSGIDARIYLGVGALLFAATFLASWLPARRASRVDPISLCAPE